MSELTGTYFLSLNHSRKFIAESCLPLLRPFAALPVRIMVQASLCWLLTGLCCFVEGAEANPTDEELNQAIATTSKCLPDKRYRALEQLSSLNLATAAQYFKRASFLLTAKEVPEGTFTVRALNDCERGIRLPGGHRYERVLLMSRLGYAWFHENSRKDVDRWADELLKKYPTEQSYEFAIKIQTLAENHDAALDEANRWCKQTGSVSALARRGSIYVRTGAYKMALADFDKILSLHPKHDRSCLNRLVVLHLMGMDDVVRRDLKSLNSRSEIQRSFGDVRVIAARMRCGLDSSDVKSHITQTAGYGVEEIEMDLTEMEGRVSKKLPLSLGEQIELGQKYFFSGHLLQSEQLFTKLINKHPEEYLPYYYRSAVYHEMGKLREAQLDRKHALMLYGRDKKKSPDR